MGTELPPSPAPRTVRTVEDLRALVGQELGVGPWHLVTQAQVDVFAEVTGDHQYIHVDPSRARETMYGGTIAHGYLTLSLLPRLTREREGVRLELPARMSVNYGLNRVRFPGPVLVGRRIRARTKLLALQEAAPGAAPWVQVTWLQTVEVEDAERPAMVAETVTRFVF
ncbi:MAG: MaoC family dehydratase [Chloroflexota bacterium]|nr:MaoC family dehydratase [Chloroflexota bacterium]